jgi:hypothetical protein
MTKNLPEDVEDLTPAWFADVLGVDVTAATIADANSGTTGRARVLLSGDDSVPASVFVKLPPFDDHQRKLVDMTGVMVLEDLTATGCTLPTPRDSTSTRPGTRTASRLSTRG